MESGKEVINSNNETRDMEDEEVVGLRPIIVNYLHHWKLILGVGIFCFIIAILYLIFYPKTYETMARVQIQEDKDFLSSGSMGLGEAAGLMKSFGLGGFGSGSAISIDDEISTLYSNRLMRKMIVKLGLYADYTNPYSFYRLYEKIPVKVVCDSVTLNTLNELVEFKISVSGNGKIQIKSKTLEGSQQFQFDNFPAVVSLKQGTFTFIRSDVQATSFKLNIAVQPPSWVGEKLADDMLIEDYSKTANIIELTYSDYERQRAKDMLNTLISAYNEEAYSYKKSIGDASLSFLDGRINHVMDELAKVERQIEGYKAENKLTDVEYDIQYYGEFMRDLRTQIIENETQTNMVDMMAEYIRKPENKYKLVPSMLATMAETEGSPLFLYNQALLEREKAIQSSNETNPLVATLTMQADKLRESAFQMIENAQQSMQRTKNTLKEQERELLAKMGSVPEQERVYVDYKRQQEIYQGVYLILLQKREEIALSIGQNVDKAKVVDDAFVKAKPVAPRKLYALIGLCVFTLIITVGWIFCKEQYLLLKRDLKKK